MSNKIRVGIVGYGTIGKRIADAVVLQPDMELVGVTVNTYNYRVEIAKSKGMDIYHYNGRKQFEDAEIELKGNLQDLVKKCDVVVDCSPSGCGKENTKFYDGVKVIYQGGEKPDVADVSFVAQCNYEKAFKKDKIRVVSCNSTGLSRPLKILDDLYGVEDVRACLIRRATDPGEIKKGPINAIVPSMEIPSHHGPDVSTVMKHFNVITTAVVVPTTVMHLHNVSVKLKQTPDLEELKDAINKTSRVRMVSSKQNIISTAHIVELGRDLGNQRGDMMEICIWNESLKIIGNEVFFMQAVHQESDVVPENIDAIRAAMGTAGKEESIQITDSTLKLAKIMAKASIAHRSHPVMSRKVEASTLADI